MIINNINIIINNIIIIDSIVSITVITTISSLINIIILRSYYSIVILYSYMISGVNTTYPVIVTILYMSAVLPIVLSIV